METGIPEVSPVLEDASEGIAEATLVDEEEDLNKGSIEEVVVKPNTFFEESIPQVIPTPMEDEPFQMPVVEDSNDLSASEPDLSVPEVVVEENDSSPLEVTDSKEEVFDTQNDQELEIF